MHQDAPFLSQLLHQKVYKHKVVLPYVYLHMLPTIIIDYNHVALPPTLLSKARDFCLAVKVCVSKHLTYTAIDTMMVDSCSLALHRSQWCMSLPFSIWSTFHVRLKIPHPPNHILMNAGGRPAKQSWRQLMPVSWQKPEPATSRGLPGSDASGKRNRRSALP